MRDLHVSVDDETYETLTLMCLRLRCTKSAFVENAVDLMLAEMSTMEGLGVPVENLVSSPTPPEGVPLEVDDDEE